MLEFKEALAGAQTIEKAVACAFVAHHHAVNWSHAGSSYDMVVEIRGQTFCTEVKDEQKYSDSDNLCVEFAQGEPPKSSGIMLSEASVTIHHFADYCIVYRSVYLRNYLYAEIKKKQMDPDYDGTRFIICGTNKNRCALIPKTFVCEQPWAEYMALKDLPTSKVFRLPTLGLPDRPALP